MAVELTNGELVGYLTLYEIHLRSRQATLGINFNPTVLGHGYGTEALRAFLPIFFAHGFNEMRLQVIAFNARAIRCYEKCGFVKVSERWDADSERCRLDIFGDSRFADVRKWFRISRGQLEALQYTMVARAASRIAPETSLDATLSHVDDDHTAERAHAEGVEKAPWIEPDG